MILIDISSIVSEHLSTFRYTPESFSQLLKLLVNSPDSFTLNHLSLAFHHLTITDGCLPAQIGSFLTALRLTRKDSDPEVVATCAKVLREYSIPIEIQSKVGEDRPICDIVGTGGDGHNTFNVSTTAGIVAAGAGCRVYKASLVMTQSTNGFS